MHKRWIQAIFLSHQLRQIFLFFHSADFGPSAGEAPVPLARTQGRGQRLPPARLRLPRRGALRAPSLAHARSARDSRRRAARPRAHARPSPPSSPAPAEPPAHASSLNRRGGNRTCPASASQSLVVAPWEAGPPRRPRALIGPRRTSGRLTGRRQLQRGGERGRGERFLLAAPAFPGCQACPAAGTPRFPPRFSRGESGKSTADAGARVQDGGEDGGAECAAEGTAERRGKSPEGRRDFTCVPKAQVSAPRRLRRAPVCRNQQRARLQT